MRNRKIPRYAVVPTHNRLAELARLICALEGQCETVVVIDNASDPPVSRVWLKSQLSQRGSMDIMLRHDDEQPPNLSRLWNRGMKTASIAASIHSSDGSEWDVAVLNDDAVVPPGWWDAVSGVMRSTTAVAASSDPFDELPAGSARVFNQFHSCNTGTRLAGWAFMLRGEVGLRADERLRWWYADDLLSLRARESGGLVHVGGFPVGNTGANSSTVGVLAEQAGRDRQTFVDITGRQPW